METHMGGGGGGSSRPVLRPNLAQILALRGLPMPDSNIRPTEIRNMAVIDDEELVAKALARALQGISPAAARINVPENGELIYPKDKNVIFLASKKEQIDFLIEHLLEAEVDLLFTDYNMHDKNGAEVSKILRKDKKFKGFIIGLTGLIQENRYPFYDCGADLVLEKPFDIETIESLFAKD
jgi:CheY-like chemotaxis protein